MANIVDPDLGLNCLSMYGSTGRALAVTLASALVKVFKVFISPEPLDGSSYLP